ncbi:hypothetical protein [Streptomyces sp. Isolate_45]|uniref:hypothetical protein n=1 Tax=Streptomyces sp. Isolate_45 TaxID=2950111 RepID=UPI002481CFCB|nr:hypothetical protein [Streptomyces sp. Isolate_45]MDA5284636.1 hypothetical protein [Streptomyces sp. Isolate_45]
MPSSARNHPYFRVVTRRDGRLCATPACWELAAVLTPRNLAARLVDAVRLDAAGLLAVCSGCARERDDAGRSAREAATAAGLAAAQLSFDITN